ncbi:transmembrane adaptor Erv26-domain-containing protein [Rhodotorula diobovata]|uniref:Transmembrane adaptor Erv26-domain-containing protein n=1 Tax=Rhodotorula diobovata TaxID=5288 RepID=A0A5C5G6G3_9BASI|nr:transmembrane adaptor Erv26-domain-containing protein [Rhodotorula diobovata]
MLEGWSVLHSLSWVALAAGFVFLLLSLASGLLYVAEVIEEHSGLAKTVGKRLVYAEVLLFVLLFAVDGLPWHLVAVGIVAHLVYLQNFSRTWPTISLTSLTFILSCLLVLLSHFLSFRHFSARSAAAAHHGRYTHYNAYDSRRGRHGGGGGHGAGAPESFLDVATYFAVCVWLVPFYLFLSLSANDNVLPSSGESRRSSPTPSSPTISVSKPSPALTASPSTGRHQRQRSSMVKAALSSAFRLVPSALRPSTLSAQLPLSDKSAARRDIPRSPSPTFGLGFDQLGGGGGGGAQGSSSGFSSTGVASGASASALSGTKPRPQPLLRTSTSAMDMRRGSAAGSNPGSPTVEVGMPSPVSPYYASSSSAALPSPSVASQRRFFPHPPPGAGGGSQPPSPANARFPPSAALSSSLGTSSAAGPRAPFPPAVPRSGSGPAPGTGMVRRNTTDRQGQGQGQGQGLSPVTAPGQQQPVGLGETGRRASEAVMMRPGAGAGGQGPPPPPPQIRRRGTTDGYGGER